jgi:hypothetical protein
MPAEYTRVTPEVRSIARDLTEEFHPELLEHSVRVEYVFVDPAPSVNGKIALGKCSKIGGKVSFLAHGGIMEKHQEPVRQDDFFLIEFWGEGFASMDMAARRYLIDHELCHCGIVLERDKNNETFLKGITLVPHEIEDFGVLPKRHGFCMPDVKAFAMAIKQAEATFGQLSLPLDVAEGTAREELVSYELPGGRRITSVTLGNDVAPVLREAAMHMRGLS